jgi:hypothetical protein
MTARLTERPQDASRARRRTPAKPRVDAQASWGEERRETLDAIHELRRRQDAADGRAKSVQDELAAVRRGLTEVRQAIDEVRQAAAPADRADERSDPRESSREVHEGRLTEVERGLAEAREFRTHAEHELAWLRAHGSELAATVGELVSMTSELRAALTPAQASAEQDEPVVSEAPAVDVPAQDAAVEAKATEPAPETSPEPAPEARPEPAVAAPPEDATVLSPPLLAAPERRSSWLAPAIRRVAERSGLLAGELITELAAFHGRIVDIPLAYELRIEELGAFVVRVGGGHATVATASGGDSALDFSLEGPAAAFASLAGGGARWRLPGLRVRGSRRKARWLLKACRRPLALADLAEADVSVWPGLLLLAMAEAVDPTWTAGSDFVVEYAIQGSPGATFYVRVHDGAPIAVSARLDDGDRPASTVYASERALMRTVAGIAPSPDEPTLLTGDPRPVQLLCGWFARAQGLGEVG